MRYATEFFGGLFHPRSAAERYAHKAAALQDLLGEVNDAAIALRLVKTIAPPDDADAAYAAGVVTGWCARESEGDIVALKKAWREVADAAPFWRRDEDDKRLESA
jgi:CHAD domain-containing protein